MLIKAFEVNFDAKEFIGIDNKSMLKTYLKNQKKMFLFVFSTLNIFPTTYTQ